jgi:hypothetical protein
MTNNLYKYGLIALGLVLVVLIFIRSRKRGGEEKKDESGKKSTGSTGKSTPKKIQPNGKVCTAVPNSRGLKNNNPGNLRIGSSAWMGKIPKSQNSDGSFEQFETWVYGVRAMTKLIRNYIKGGTNTINKIINKYAPPSDGNNTNRYIAFLVGETGILANKPIDPDDKTVMRKLIKGIVKQELGCYLVTDAEFNKAWDLL